jgi:hypothetical protein
MSRPPGPRVFCDIPSKEWRLATPTNTGASARVFWEEALSLTERGIESRNDPMQEWRSSLITRLREKLLRLEKALP